MRRNYDATKVQDTDLTVTVGSGGDYLTINAALEELSQYTPIYKAAGVTVTISLLTGFVMAEQVLVKGLDLGWITITGVDASTSITHTALTTDFTTTDYGFGSYPAFGVSKGGTLPRIGQLFIMSSGGISGSQKHGVMAIGAGSSADILPACGVQSAATHGIYAANGSTINATSADASSAGFTGIYAANGSTINADSANASSAGFGGIEAKDGSTINADNADARSAGSTGIFAGYGSVINADSANASSAAIHGVWAGYSSRISAYGVNASSAGSTGIYASYNSTVNAHAANANSAGDYGIRAIYGSVINAPGADASSAGSIGIYVRYGSTINANGCSINNQTTGTYAVNAQDGSLIEVSSISTTGTTVTIFNQAINTLTSNGIIFQ